MKTLTLPEAAELLHIHPMTLQEKARSGEIPGAKLGKCWVFIDVDLIEYIRSKYQARALQGEQKEEPLCHSTNAKIHPITGSKLPTRTDAYSEALGLMTKRRPKSTTIS